MKQLLLFLLTILFISSQAQTSNNYQADLLVLQNILQKTPSYQNQIKGQKLIDYNSLVEKLREDAVRNASDYKYFYNLAQLFFPISDNHLSFYQTANFPNDSDFPTFTGNVDSLKSVLKKRSLDSLEGIYNYDKYYTVGLYRANNAEYIGVVLNSKVPNWKKGQIAIHLYEFMPNYFKAIYAHPKNKNYILQPIEKFTNHSLINSNFYSSLSEKEYSKSYKKNDFVNIPKSLDDFVLKTIKPGIQYLHIKQFSADMIKREASKKFYDSIKNLLIEPYLILDLRNNKGGSFEVSQKFVKLIEQYTKVGKVFILVNNGTLSQGEIFTLQLKQLPNVKILGQTTKGMLTYGSNYGKRSKLPSQSFEVFITDFEADKRLLQFENYGINPDVVLLNTKDWIKQTMDIIRK